MAKKQDLPAMPFYIGDWFKSPEIRALSLPTRMIWFEMLCFMWQSNDRGKLSINGKPIIEISSDFVITNGQHVLAQMLGVSLQQLQEAITEMGKYGVFSVDDNGVLYSRFMLKIVEIQQKRSISGKKGMNSRYAEKISYNKNLTNDITNIITNTEDEDENENISGVREIGGVGEREEGGTEDEVFIRKLFAAMFNQMPDLYQRATTENLIKQFGKEKVREAFLKARDAGVNTFKKNYILAILNNQQENHEKGSTITGIQHAGNNGRGRTQNIPQRQYRAIKTDDEIRADLAKVYGKSSA